MKSLRTLIAVIAISFFIGGCGGSSFFPSFGQSTSSENNFVHNGINFGPDRDEDYKRGVRDGCTTAGGHYAKDHSAFRGNVSYKSGWESGRLMCGSNTKQQSVTIIQ